MITDGLHGTTEYLDEGIIFVLSECVKEGYIDLGPSRRISREMHNSLRRSKLKPRDVLVTKTGVYFGKSAVVPESLQESNTIAHVARLVPRPDINPYYLSLFLNTSLGQFQLRRRGIKGTRPEIKLVEFQDILVPVPPRNLQQTIEASYHAAEHARTRAQSLYVEAHALLLTELGLDALDLSHQPTYAQSFSQVWEAGRLDAEYFSPKYQQAMQTVAQSGKVIGDVAQLAKRRFEPKAGKPFRYIEIGDVGPAGHAESQIVPGEDAPSRAQWIVESGDVITSTVRPIRRLSALIEPEQDGYVCSSGFAVLKPIDIEPEVLLVYLRLPVVCEILDLHTSASMYPAISTTDLLNVPIPIPSEAARDKVVNLIQDSRKGRQEAKRLLEEAKRRVEQMVLRD